MSRSSQPLTWKRGAPDPRGELQRNLLALADLFEKHGRLLQAISAAATRDSELRSAYMNLADRLIATTASRIETEVSEGRSAVRDPAQVASALVWMNERYPVACFGRPPLADPATAANALAEIWIATIYGRSA